MRFERDDAKIGLLVFAALALFTGLILHRSVSAAVKHENVLRVRLDNVADLAVGTEVLLQGLHVGQVDRIELQHEGVRYAFIATCSIRPDITLWNGTHAAVSSKGIGSSFLEIQLPPDTARTQILPAGSLIPGERGASIGSVVDEAHALLRNLNQSVDELRGHLRTQGLGAVLDHPQIHRVLVDLDETVKGFHQVASDSSALTVAGARSLQSLDRSLASLEKTMATLQTILEKRTDDVNAIVQNLSGVLKELQGLSGEIRGIVQGSGPEIDANLKALHRNLTATETLLEILKAKPNRIIWGTPSAKEQEAAQKRVDQKAHPDPNKNTQIKQN